jgi:hypothetical protein
LSWRVVAGLLISAALLLAMRETTPNYDARVGPVIERGKPGKFVHGRRFAARVDAVATASRLRFTRAADTVEQRDSSGTWLIVQASAMAVREPSLIGSAAILTRDGRRYDTSGRLYTAPGQLTARELQPGVASQGLLIFELPADAVAGATLVLAANRLDRLDSELRIALGLTTAPAPREFYDLVRP